MRPDLPTGTVTFLFTDVEGSTKLLHEFGAEGYADALADHRRVIREACSAQRGVEVDTQGDAFFFAFPSAEGALTAAAAFTEALSRGPIRVRVGLHTGTPLVAEEGYVGDDVHFAARVASSGHGGQVVVSLATAELALDGLTELGEHRLKDIEQAIPLYQLGEGSFPPLKTISNTNLPRPASSFVGRERELEEVLARIDEGARLLTLTGPGGTGKTRLALEAALTLVPEYRAGVFWVGLAALRDPALVPETVAQVLGAKDSLASHIADREMLLLLDNLEQVVEAAPELGALLSACPGLTLLVTSRELLRISGEVEYPVPPLEEAEAVFLFSERSRLEPSAEIAELCRRLDSLPLAVELAAARTSVLTPVQILERLSGRLDLLKGGRDADPRQQTLRATVEWSYELLSPAEQDLFARLSVFAGGCTLEAAEEVADADLDTLQSLVEKSLLRFTDSRYWMLESIREYAGERLRGSREMETSERRHAQHYLFLAEQIERRRSEATWTEHLQRLDDEHDNVRVSLSAFIRRNEAEDALRLVCALAEYWVVRGYFGEARSHVEAALAIPVEQPSELRTRALAIGSDCARDQGDVDGARRFCEESLRLSRKLGDVLGVARALHELGEAEMAEENFDRATELLQEAVTVARSAGHNAAGSVGNLGYIALLEGDYETARTLSEEATQLFRDRGHQSGVAMGLAFLADAELMVGRTERARLRTQECLRFAEELGFTEVISMGLDTSAALLTELGQMALAARLTGTAEALREEINVSQTPAERRLHRRTRENLEASLGDDVLGELRAEGRVLDVADAVALAIAALD